jgi:hypothetical protein
VASSPMIEQLHCSGPTGRISWIMDSFYGEIVCHGFTRIFTDKPEGLCWLIRGNP